MNDQTVKALRRVMDEPDLSGTRYQLVEEIARGGMGVIWAAVDTVLDRRVALKVLPAWNEAQSELLRKEAAVLAKLEHPGIVPVHDAGTLPGGRGFYAMKLVQGRSLDQVRTGATRADLLRLFQRICEPVAFAHSCGVIHRDLKPENVMVGAFGEVLVMDWGVAKTAGIRGESGLIGTPEFMSPEQAAGDNDRVDERSDVYGLGGILKYLLAAHETPKPLAAICASATAGDSSARYTSASELAADVGRFLDGEPVRVYRENLFEIAMRWTLRNHTLVLLLLAYLIMRGLLLFVLGR